MQPGSPGGWKMAVKLVLCLCM